MKKVTSIALMMVFALSLSFIGCKKYQEGPAISLASKKGRVEGVWKVSKSFTDGTEDTCDSDCTEGRDKSSVTYTKDGKYTSSSVWVILGVASDPFETTGKWLLSADKMSILVDWDDDDPDMVKRKRDVGWSSN